MIFIFTLYNIYVYTLYSFVIKGAQTPRYPSRVSIACVCIKYS